MIAVKRKAVFIPYRPKTILNKGKRADPLFWTRYSAYPYIGCQHGCEFCYCRERKYCPHDDPLDFAYVIKIKANAAVLLRRALSRVPVDLVFTGDYQPVERKFGISRQMLEVCYELGFPVFVLERNPGVLRDLDLLQAINQRYPSVVPFSIITTPDSPDYERVCQMEHLAPPAAKRFTAMEKIAAAGILTGTVMMPILPGLCDRVANLESVVRWTADHGGKFVLSGGLTLSDQQKDYFFGVLQARFPDLLPSYQKLYPEKSYAPAGWPQHKVAMRVRELCLKYGIYDRIPRPILPSDKRALNRRIVEILAEQLYSLELENAPGYRQWEVRKAAWAIEDLEQDIGLVYRTLGLKGLQSIENVGVKMGILIEKLIKESR
jgi:DNA repair photolyase